MSDRILSDRMEAARLRLQRSDKFAVKDVVEILQAIPTPVVVPEKKTEEENLIAKELLKELRRLSKAIEGQEPSPAPIVNVAPASVSVSAPAVNVSPQVQVTAPQQWRVDVTDHYTFGPMQGKIKTVLFTAM